MFGNEETCLEMSVAEISIPRWRWKCTKILEKRPHLREVREGD